MPRDTGNEARPEAAPHGSGARALRMLALGGAALLVLVLATEAWVWINLWPISASWGEALLWSVPQVYMWIVLVPAVLWLAGRFPIEGGTAAPRAGLHLAASVAFSLVALGAVDLSDEAIHWTRLLGAPSALVADIRYTIIHLHFGIAVYWITLGTRHAVRYYGKYRERAVHAARLESQLTRAQLDTLRARLQPHFLFNTLNSIAVLMRRDAAEAERMLHRLSDLLRASLDRGSTSEVTLEEELAFTRQYLEIEEARFQDRLRLAFDIEPETLTVDVPSFILQPIVENAVRHAVAPTGAPGTITIRARRIGEALELAILDEGPGMAPGSGNGSGLGLANTRQRLETLYGDSATLTVKNRTDGGVEAAILLPAPSAPPAPSP